MLTSFKPRKRVYVAAPFTGDEIANTNFAIDKAEELVDLGFAPVVPHLSIHWSIRHRHSYKWWLQLTCDWMLGCEMVLRTGGPSPGADLEVQLAEQMGIPVYYDTGELQEIE